MGQHDVDHRHEQSAAHHARGIHFTKTTSSGEVFVNQQVIDCPRCDAKVAAVTKAEVVFRDDNDPYPQKVALVVCPSCKSPLVGTSEELQVGHDEYEWMSLYRVWPPREDRVHQSIPEIVQISLHEAHSCFSARAFSACAVMCGRAIEGLCIHHDPKLRTLAKGLGALKTSGVIDTRLFEWGEALRKHRNLGAHATTERVSKEDARDLLDFASAICDYVFVLNEKFERFRARQKGVDEPLF